MYRVPLDVIATEVAVKHPPSPLPLPRKEEELQIERETRERDEKIRDKLILPFHLTHTYIYTHMQAYTSAPGWSWSLAA